MAPNDLATLDSTVESALLKKIWRTARKSLRRTRLQELHLGKDPLEWLWFDWELDQSLSTLRRDVLAGTYRAAPPEVIRAAKTVGLTRPLSFLQPRELILYKAIVASGQVALLEGSPSWTRLGRFQPGDDDSPAESGWFRSFLRRQGQVWRISQNHAFVLETDIANFFPYVNLQAISAHVLSRTNLSPEVVRLLEHMLKQFSPLVEYREAPTVGLPQESFECSRVLAHTFLEIVDVEFMTEGQSDRYSRYMDDIVIGCDSFADSLQLVRRIQLALEKVGL
jgi:hypothetical protein